jgi:hypothetical protein
MTMMLDLLGDRGGKGRTGLAGSSCAGYRNHQPVSG